MIEKKTFILFLLLISSQFAFGQSPHGNNFKIDCSQCHRADNWKELLPVVKFDHDSTNFSLEGQHKTVNCQSCHKSLVFSEAQADCISCHRDIHQNTVSTQCESCHSPESWLLTNIDQIHQENRFPLTGLHQSLDCSACHKKFGNFNFEVIGTNCYDCHQADYLNTVNPNHSALGYPVTCESCHQLNNITWAANNVAHDFFPLVEGHAITNCFNCHQNGKQFNSISSDCFDCHKKQYNSAVSPNHITNNLPTDCTECHSISSFVPSTFQHDKTAFILTGSHISTDCSACHTSGYQVKLQTDCYSCHQQKFDGTTNPNHIQSGFPTDCSLCHTTTDWLGATFDHQTTGFQLTGAHSSLDCASCHSTGYKGTPTDCYSCHQQKFDGTTNPNHIQSGFPTDCSLCHTTTDWLGATFDHQTTKFPLKGAHANLDCNSCHSSGYVGTPTDCYSCHQQNYNSTTSPNHAASGFPTNCEQCHSQNSWTPSTFNHSFYALSSPHINLNCAECHSEPNFKPQCMSCHSNDFFKEHKSGDPQDCWRCHTTFKWDD